jgi:hypothetical protein
MRIDWTAPLQWKDVIGPTIAVLAVAVGLYQYRATSERDFVKPLRETQMRIYQEASAAAAGIATLPRESAEWKQSRNDFLRLYHGPLAIFEDFDHASQQKLTVELAMIIFKSAMDDNASPQILEGLSLALAHSCRESLGTSWGYDLPQLKGEYQKRALEYWSNRGGQRS